MKSIIAAILFTLSLPAMATNPKPPEPTSGSQEQSQTAKGGDQHQTATGGKQGQQQSQTGGSQSTQQDNDQSLVSENEVFAPVDVNSTGGGAQVGDVLATGVVGGVSASGGAGGHGGLASSDASFSPYKSFNTSISETTYHARDIHMASLVLSECSGSISGATDKNEKRFFGIAFTVRNRDCNAIRNSMAVDGLFDDKEWAREILCARDTFRDADARKVQPLCHANVSEDTAASYPARELVAGR